MEALRMVTKSMTDVRSNGDMPSAEPVELGHDHFMCEVSVVNEMGLHARPASLVVGIANKYPCQITIERESNRVDAKSILQLLSLSAEMGTKLKLEARGEEAKAALTALVDLVRQGFLDPPSTSEPIPSNPH